jgi:hypothetical protein
MSLKVVTAIYPGPLYTDPGTSSSSPTLKLKNLASASKGT